MLNIILTIIVFYYLVKTGDLFKLMRMGKNLLQDFLISLKKDKQGLEENINPLEILKLRYVQGEIDKAEYEQILKNI
ncbi:SHOCT domain-containing protein [Bacillaceae bacterium S4-13-58]